MKTITIILCILALSHKSTSVSDKGCIDKTTNCKHLTRFCNISKEVKEKCKKTCGACNQRCIDKTTDCKRFTRFCNVYKEVTEKCPKTCGVCNQRCVNKAAGCQNFIEFCHVYHEVMEKCQKSCGACNPKPEPDCECGKYNVPRLRIVGGTEALKNKYPWLVSISLFRYPMPMCGGSIINTRYILTAGHCTYLETCKIPFRGKDMTITVAEHNIISTNDDIKGVTERIKVKKIIRHKEYCRYPTGNTADNDIALLLLPKDIDLTPKELGLPCLPPTPWTTYEGKTVSVAGWGFNQATGAKAGTRASNLLEVSFKVMEGCELYPYRQFITKNMICAGDPVAVKDSCDGDSGGPLVYKSKNNRYTQVGIVSFGPPGGNCTGVGVYTRVAHYVDWIRENTKDGECEI